jgi:Plasmid replication initiator protein
MSSRHTQHDERAQLDLFRALPGDLAPRDAQDLMAYPFFSLAKSKRLTPIDFKAGSVKNPRRSRARARHGDDLGRDF